MSDTNRPVQSKKKARRLKFRIEEEEEVAKTKAPLFSHVHVVGFLMRWLF